MRNPANKQTKYYNADENITRLVEVIKQRSFPVIDMQAFLNQTI